MFRSHLLVNPVPLSIHMFRSIAYEMHHDVMKRLRTSLPQSQLRILQRGFVDLLAGAMNLLGVKKGSKT